MEHWLKRMLAPAKCRPGRQFGLHGVVLTNCGGMGDAELCLRCGLEYYPSLAPLMLAEERREIRAPEDWPAMEQARRLPGGISEGESPPPPAIVDVERTPNGWPLVPPEAFTEEQLIREASRWAHLRGSPYVGGGEFAKYDNELKRRGRDVDWSHIEMDWY